MPQLGNTVEECLLTRWRKRVGEAVRTGDVVAEIETDKTTFEVPSPVDGTLLATFCDEGALVPVLTTIFVVGRPGEAIEGLGPASTSAPAPLTEAAGAAASAPAAPASPPVERPVSGMAPAAAPYSPRASRFAVRHNFHPPAIIGSGPGGRILERDLRLAYDARAQARAPGVRAEERASGVRATVARRMRESLATTAQYTLDGSADATGLLALRERIKSAASAGGTDVTITDLVAFCTVRALVECPDLNAEFIDGRIVRHAAVHLAFAVDTPRGLMAPVVRDAQTLAIEQLSRRMRELAGEAASGTLSAEDLSGATFTISNLGHLGIESFTPLINPPQVAILGVGSVRLQPRRKKERAGATRIRETSARRAMAFAESVEFVERIGLSLTCDHQVIDGAPAARFLQVLAQKIAGVEKLLTADS
jgi:pyruvate dehydrogenase E2 component (dihydrolipoamide acetyltransferase)